MSGTNASTIADLLSNAASATPDAIWLTTPETNKHYSWQNSFDRASEIACYLRGRPF